MILIGLATAERLWWDLGPNIELITLTTVLAGFYLDKKAAIIVALLTLAISDIFLGNTAIMLFTWSAYLVIAFVSIYLKSKTNTSSKRIILATFGGGLGSFWFYLWTNFGVWLLDSWGMYSKDISGLIICYVNGLPFLKNQLLCNLMIIPVGFILTEVSLLIFKKPLFQLRPIGKQG